MAPGQSKQTTAKLSDIVPPAAKKVVNDIVSARRVATPASANMCASAKASVKEKSEAFSAATGCPSEIADHIATFLCPNCKQTKPEDEKVVPLYGVSEQAVPLRGSGTSF